MKNDSFRNSIRTAFVVLVLCCFTLAQAAEAAGPSGAGGGRGGGGGGRAGGGGGRQNMQANHGRADARTNNVRSTSVNNVNRNANRNVNQNVNRNVNVNNNVNIDRDVHIDVDNHGGCCNNGWDNDYYPVARAAAVTATVAVTAAVVGSMVHTVPPGFVPVNYAGMVYQQCGGTWYQPQGTQFVVINPPY